MVNPLFRNRSRRRKFTASGCVSFEEEEVPKGAMKAERKRRDRERQRWHRKK